MSGAFIATGDSSVKLRQTARTFLPSLSPDKILIRHKPIRTVSADQRSSALS